MSTTFTLDTATSRANPTPAPMKRLTVPAIRQRKEGGDAEPIVMLTAYTARMAQLLDPHCDLLLVGDSLGQVIYGLPSTRAGHARHDGAHGAAVVRGSYHAVVVVDMPFGSYEASPEAGLRQRRAAAQGNRRGGGEARGRRGDGADDRLPDRARHPGDGPCRPDPAGGQRARRLRRARPQRGRSAPRSSPTRDAVAEAGAFALVVEGVVEPIADRDHRAVACPTIGIGASAQCDGQVLVTEDMLGMFERTPRFVKRYDDLAGAHLRRGRRPMPPMCASRAFPGAEQIYAPKD